MERITIKCRLSGEQAETELQLDRKAMPGEPGPSFMVTSEGYFKGYITRQSNRVYYAIGDTHFTAQDLTIIGEHLNKKIR
ncbi:hypothetical protein FPZ42_06950 [Mucilaginibacter achroorhodeus]|uniref:Uncharacterized protein n=1 Tax=Mucilaginibacter achroorhodeus TaxID=2599294 RepID=A0A563U5Z0_9SPHI|nr:hypothetical protein [Mucilaginibacter achroorhodeus]TWR26768.1 hypothetical protein FPZ42_06950 [Mucilaginibacter achroorhodeus]